LNNIEKGPRGPTLKVDSQAAQRIIRSETSSNRSLEKRVESGKLKMDKDAEKLLKKAKKN